VKFRIAPELNLTSLTRYGQSSNAYATTGASSGTRFVNGNSGPTYTGAALDGGHTGWQEVDYFAHQSNLRWNKEFMGLKHEFIFGAEFTDHKVESGNYNALNGGATNCFSPAANGGTPAAARCLTTANGSVVGNLANLAGRSYSRNGRNQDWQVKTVAVSAMDTVDLTDRFTVFGGVRADHFDLSLLRYTPATGATSGDYSYNDTLFNGHLGLSYKVAPGGIVYGSFASAQDINAGEADSGTNSGYGGAVLYQGQIAGAKPESSKNFEIGTKWNLFNEKLLATAAIFRSTKSDVMEGANYDTVGTFNSGKNRVQGVEFGLAGNITEQLSAQVGVALMKAKVLESATAANVGRTLSNFADQSWSAQAKYQVNNAFSFGAAARYESSRCGGQPDTAAGFAGGNCSQPVPSYTVYDLFAAYRFSRKLDVRVNVLNVGDKDYYTAVYRSGAFLYKGDARAVRFTLNYEM
jgi:catecholate siderophore receptor